MLLARDLRLNRLVALKMPRRRPNGASRLIEEARTLALLRHENIVVVHEVGLLSRRPYMTLEYIRGCTLRELAAGGAVRTPVALDLVIPVVRALAHAHDMGVVHRDLKPQNIMVADAGPIKLLDFGLAAHFGARPAETAEQPPRDRRGRGPVGTLLYMSPEELRMEDTDQRSDIWALGVILQELVAGVHPFAPFTPGWLSRVAASDVPVEIQVRDDPLSAGLGEIIRRCLRKPRGERFRTARELLRSLEDLRSSGGRARTWSGSVETFKRGLARASYEEHGSYPRAARALAVNESTLRRHADGRALPPR